tara:strand:- start:23 stop:430 length:408 start_codon:yes stop_codon:yes gene_type:complete
MATDKRSYPNDYFAWFNDDNSLAIVAQISSNDVTDSTETTLDKFDTYTGDSVNKGIRLHFHAKYGDVNKVTDDLRADSGLDTGLNSAIVDYVKSRLLEDSGDLQRASYYRNKYERTIKKYPHRKSGIRALTVPRM